MIDLDGVVWRGAATVQGAPEAVAELRAAGVPLAFVTNSAARSAAEVAEKLAGHGIPDAEDLVISASMAAAALVQPGERAVVIGSEGLRAALRARGAEVVDAAVHDDGDVVVVGITPEFDYVRLTNAMRAIQDGARFIATNDDATFPDAEGLLPGNGALVAALATATGVDPEIAGKPHGPITELVRDRLGPDGIVAGDRPETDGLFASALGYDFGLVLTGVTGPEDLPVTPPPRFVAADLLELVHTVHHGR